MKGSINVWVAVAPKLAEEVIESKQGSAKAKPELAKRSKKEQELFASAVDHSEFTHRKVTKASKQTVLQSLYVDTEDDLKVLEDSGVVILGAWDWEGNRLRDPDPDMKKYMPPKYDEEGNEIVDDSLRDVNLMYGQKERNFD